MSRELPEDRNLRLYYDAEGQQPIDGHALDLGDVIPGDTVHYTFYLRNESDRSRIVSLKATVDDPDIRFVKLPAHLGPAEIASIVVEYAPGVDRVEPPAATFTFEVVRRI